MPSTLEPLMDDGEAGGLFDCSDSEGSIAALAPPPLWRLEDDRNTNADEDDVYCSAGLFATPPKEVSAIHAAPGRSGDIVLGHDGKDGKCGVGAPPLLTHDQGHSSDEGGLFDSSSDSEPATTVVTTSQVQGSRAEDSGCLDGHARRRCQQNNGGDVVIGATEIVWWGLEDACNNIFVDGKRRCDSLGSVLSSAIVMPDEEDAPSRSSLLLKISQKLLIELAMSPNDVRDAIQATRCGVEVIMSDELIDDHWSCSLRLSKMQEMDDVRAVFVRILNHIVDLPLHRCEPPAQKRAKLSNSCINESANPCTQLDMDAFLDDLCQERAELLLKSAEQQQAYRERIIVALAAKRSRALEECRELEKRATVSRQLTSRDRWVLQEDIKVASGNDCKSLLQSAKEISKLWSLLPASEREVFQIEALIDRGAPGGLVRAKDLQDWADELEVFLHNLEPCSECNSWDPWVDSCKRRPGCSRRTCTNCKVLGYCSPACADNAAAEMEDTASMGRVFDRDGMFD